MEPYPDIEDPGFQSMIAERLEFRNLYNKDGLYPHQEFVRRFMSPHTPYRSLILYHSLGSGKSIACIAVAVDHYLYDGKKCIIVTKGDSGTTNFANQIRMYRSMSASGQRGEWDASIFVMKHYIQLSNQVNNMSDGDVAAAFSSSIIVLDEVHNVRYLKKVTENSVYGSIVRILKLCTAVKVIIATATPMTDNHEQINSLLGICNYSREDPHSMRGIISYNCVIRDRPESVQMGTSRYVPGVHVWASEMTGYQRDAYLKEDTDKPPEDIYRKLTHISLFCFEDGTHGKEVTERKMKKTKVLTTITSMSTNQTRAIKYTKYSILPELSSSLVGSALRRSSSKYSAVVDLLESSEGNVFIFLEEVKGSGLLLLASVLEHHGYELYLGDSIDNMSPGKRYTMCVGSSDICPNNNDRLEGFNCDANKNGSYVRVLLGSRVIGESITLKNVRQFYCLTPHWNDSTVDQAIGRVIRNKSHESLGKGQKSVNIYIHASIFPDNPYNSVDIKKLMKCKEKEKDILRVTQKMVDEAVDKYCLLDEPPLQVTYVDTFAAAYLHHHEDAMVRLISDVMEGEPGPIDVDDLSHTLGAHPTVCKEALCRMITSNTRVCGGFIRAYGNCVFLVGDPSVPYVSMPPVSIAPGIARSDYGDIGELVHDMDMGFPHVIQTFRYMRARDKTAFIEYCVQMGLKQALGQVSTAYANIGGTVYHLLLYRDLESSYTSSNPVPKRPLGKTRAFDSATSTWYTVDSVHEEQPILEEYRLLVNSLLQQEDERLGLYGVISAIDGEMRLRLRGAEDTSKSSSDRRYIKRGKNIRSIRKEQLLWMLHCVGGPLSSVGDSTPINEIVSLIDTALVHAGLYVVF